MIRGLYIAASAALTETKRVDVIANNIANVNTAGYKKDLMLSQSFPEVLVSRINAMPDTTLMKNRLSSSGTTFENTDGYYKVTTGSGFFNVQTPEGISRNRSIAFKVGSDGNLVTSNGDYVLGQNGPINASGGDLTVDSKGQVLVNGTVVDQLKVSNPLNVIGSLNYGVHVDEIATNFEQGQLTPTGNSMDLAIQGKGYFVVETPQGERYTRDGQLSKNAENYLVTAEGYMVIGENGPIQIEGNDMVVNEKGEVMVDGKMVDQLSLVNFKDEKLLRKEGDGLYLIDGNAEDNKIAFDGAVQQGSLESSNVNSVKEMVDMMTILRSYEASQKIIKIEDELLGRAVNDIARV